MRQRLTSLCRTLEGTLRSPSLSDHKPVHASRRRESAAIPGLDFCSSIHCSRLLASLVIEKTLARCGHHFFLDGCATRHRAVHQPCLRGSDHWSVCHADAPCLAPGEARVANACTPWEYVGWTASQMTCSCGPFFSHTCGAKCPLRHGCTCVLCGGHLPSANVLSTWY